MDVVGVQLFESIWMSQHIASLFCQGDELIAGYLT
jgi:hypothetical protein